jgi:hypothetical protein
MLLFALAASGTTKPSSIRRRNTNGMTSVAPAAASNGTGRQRYHSFGKERETVTIVRAFSRSLSMAQAVGLVVISPSLDMRVEPTSGSLTLVPMTHSLFGQYRFSVQEWIS